jgi:hypothetical protein
MQKFEVTEGSRGDHYLLSCPTCGETATVHVDTAMVAARPAGEDGPITLHQIDSRGEVTTPDSVPVGEPVGEGRRHRITLGGWCERGHKFAIVYSQHKGMTYVETVDLGST